MKDLELQDLNEKDFIEIDDEKSKKDDFNFAK